MTMGRRSEIASLTASMGASILRSGEVTADLVPGNADWDELLRMELEATREEGCLDMGTHIIVVATK
jgi:hypothetical protein